MITQELSTINSAPRTTIPGSGPPHPETERSCLHHGRKKLYQGQSRLPQTSLPNLARLNDGVERRRPKPKIQYPPEYYKNLINKFDNTTIKRKIADTTIDNLQGIIDKFSR
jgi:hypothetical protein